VAVPFDLRRRGLENSPQLDAIKKKAKNEVDVRYIGRVLKFATPAHRKRTRPLKIGVSVPARGWRTPTRLTRRFRR
jgi:hypothetical protein